MTKMAEAELRNMIMNFRVTDLQVLLSFAGRNKTGKKQELQARALDLTKMKSPAVELKIKELHSRRYQQLGSRPASYDIPDRTLTDRPLPNYQAPMNNSYARCNSGMRPMPMNQGATPSYSEKPYIPSMPPPPQPSYQPYLNVKFKDLPFFDILHILLRPFSLISDPVDRLTESTYTFTLNPQQAHDVSLSKDSTGNYGCQLLLRFCIVDSEEEQDDNFPPQITLKVNGKPVPLPNPIPTNRPGVEPKRPSKPVNISPYTKLSPIVTNIITVGWSATYGRSYAAELTIGKLLTSQVLLSRLKNRGFRTPEETKAMIREKLQQGLDSDIATTSLQASLMCPLGKRKMQLPCRAITCSHIACFDASLYIQLNEKKPKWRCPVCDKPALYKNLILDGLFMDIICSVSPDCTDVQLHDDGSWTAVIPVSKEQKDIKKLEEKKKNDSVVCLDISSDSDTDDGWSSNIINNNNNNNNSSCNGKNGESPPLVYLPSPTSPIPNFSPVSSPNPSFLTNYASPGPSLDEPVPVHSTSNIQSELTSSEHLNILPDIIPQPLNPENIPQDNMIPSMCNSNSGLGANTYPPYLPTDYSAFCATNAFQDQPSTNNNHASNESNKEFDLFSLMIPQSVRENYEKVVEAEPIPDIISLD